MVVFSKQPAELWEAMQALTSAHPHLASLQFDHVVNLGDMVPRLLGSNFSSLHTALRTQLQVPDDAALGCRIVLRLLVGACCGTPCVVSAHQQQARALTRRSCTPSASGLIPSTNQQSWLPALPETQELALHYHPFGCYRALATKQLRKVPAGKPDPVCESIPVLIS